MVCNFDKAPVCITPDTGAIRVKNSDLVLRAAMPKAVFLDSDLYRHTQTAGYYPLENGIGHGFLVSFTDPVFGNIYLRLSFENDQLGIVDFGWGPQVTMPEWTKERVEYDVAKYRAFLVGELGPIARFPCTFPWGKVYAAKDEKAGTPATGIRYTGFEFRAKNG